MSIIFDVARCINKPRGEMYEMTSVTAVLSSAALPRGRFFVSLSFLDLADFVGFRVIVIKTTVWLDLVVSSCFAAIKPSVWLDLPWTVDGFCCYSSCHR